MKDKTVTYDDVIDLSVEQRELITTLAKSRTAKEWYQSESGVKIPLEDSQKEIVIANKNTLIEAKDERRLIDEQIIVFTQHSRDRIALRVDKTDPTVAPSLDSIILIVKLIIESEELDDMAEWKGKKNLVYTLLHKEYDERFKISISFEKIGTDYIKVITVSNEHIKELSTRLSAIPKVRESLDKMRASLDF
jgi:hypothetical protein